MKNFRKPFFKDFFQELLLILYIAQNTAMFIHDRTKRRDNGGKHEQRLTTQGK